MVQSNYEHAGIQIANYNGSVLAVGGSTTTSDSVEVYSDNEWSDMAAYPYSTVLYKFAVISTAEGVYYYGGYDGEDFQSQIAKIANNEWSQVGTLKSPSTHISAIKLGDGVLIVGGYG